MDTTGIHVLESVTTAAKDANSILILGGVKDEGIGNFVKTCCSAKLSKVGKSECPVAYLFLSDRSCKLIVCPDAAWDWEKVHATADVKIDDTIAMLMFEWVEDAIQYCASRPASSGLYHVLLIARCAVVADWVLG